MVWETFCIRELWETLSLYLYIPPFLIQCCGTNLFKKTGNKAEPKISFVILGGALSFIMYSLSKEMPCKLLGLVVLKGANGGLCHLEYLGPFLQNY